MELAAPSFWMPIYPSIYSYLSIYLYVCVHEINIGRLLESRLIFSIDSQASHVS